MKKYILSIYLLVGFAFSINAQSSKPEQTVFHGFDVGEYLCDILVKENRSVEINDDKLRHFAHYYTMWLEQYPSFGEQVKAKSTDNYTTRIKKVMGTNILPYVNYDNIKVIVSEELFIVATIENITYVSTKLIDSMSDAELFALLEYEAILVILGVPQSTFEFALMALPSEVFNNASLAEPFGENEDYQLDHSLLMEINELYFTTPLSTESEFANDEYAYNFLKDNNKNPETLFPIFRKMAKMEADTTTDSLRARQLLARFRNSEERIARLEEKALSVP